VADAGECHLRVRTNGQIRTLATFPPRMVPAPPFLGLPPGSNIPMQTVPTTVVQGPDGWLYVGQLTGFPFPVGGAYIYRVPSQGGTPEVAATGFTNIIDIAFDRYSTLYVLQIGNGLAAPGGPPLNAPGKLIRVNADATQTVIIRTCSSGRSGDRSDGAAYVTSFDRSAEVRWCGSGWSAPGSLGQVIARLTRAQAAGPCRRMLLKRAPALKLGGRGRSCAAGRAFRSAALHPTVFPALSSRRMG
jgi:hypothetical protein